MIIFSGVSLGKTLSDVTFTFDGASLCIVSADKAEARAVTDLISGIRKNSDGELTNGFGTTPTFSASIPESLTVRQLLTSVSDIGKCRLSDYSHSLASEYYDSTVRSLSPYEKATVAVAALFACESDAVIADRISDGLLMDERQKLLDLIFKSADETDTALIYTTVSAAEMEKSEYVLALADGNTLFFGKTEDFISRASMPCPVSLYVMGDKAKAEAFFKKHSAEAEDGTKKNTYKATLPAGTDVADVKKSVRASGLTLLDVRTVENKCAELYKLLQQTDEVLTEQYEEYKEEHAAPRKLELSDFAFNRDDDEEDDE